MIGGSIVGQIAAFLLPTLAYAKWKTSEVRASLRLHAVSSGILLRVISLAVTGIGVALLVQRAMRPVLERYFADLIPLMETLAQLVTPRTPGALLQNLFSIGIMGPICEELFFRGAFQGTLEKRGPVRAIFISALMFALMHCNPFNFLDCILFGIALGFVVWRTGSIVPAVLWHMINNSLAMLVLYFGGSKYENPIWVDVGLTTLFVVLFWEFIQYTRPARREPSLLASAPALNGERSFRIVVAAGFACGMFLLGAMICFSRCSIADDLLAPDYRSGEVVVYKREWFLRPQELKAADVILFSDHRGTTLFSRILNVSGDSLTLLRPAQLDGKRSDLVIDRKNVLGKVVWKYNPGDELKELMPFKKANSSITAKEPEKP